MVKYCKPSSMKSVMVQICPPLLFLFHIVFQGQEYAIGPKKERKYLSVEKEEMNLSLFLHDRTVCLGNSNYSEC